MAKLLDVFTAVAVASAGRLVPAAITRPEAIRAATGAALAELVSVKSTPKGTRLTLKVRVSRNGKLAKIRVPQDRTRTPSGERPPGRVAGTIAEGDTFGGRLTVDFDQEGRPVKARTIRLPGSEARPEPYTEVLQW